MKVLVYPHDLGIGGSQLNAIDLAAATRELGHDVAVFGEPGPLTARIAELGLDFVAAPHGRVRPSPGVVKDLRRIVREREIDVVHGYEWPPAIQAILAVAGTQATAVSTVMSMSVAPFIPRQHPLVVGTQAIAAAEKGLGRERVWVIEPPVDLSHDDPDRDYGSAAFRQQVGAEPDSLLVVVVGRLAQALKLEGLLTAIRVAPTLGANVQLVIVGDGASRPDIERGALVANTLANRNAVIVVGALADPRPAYAAADVMLGMGGSALRALSFGKPLVVQGERGYWSLLTPESFGQFAWAGWYGLGLSTADGPAALSAALSPLVGDPRRRAELGAYGRRLAVECFSLERAARAQVDIYEAILATRPRYSSEDATRSAAAFVQHALARKVRRLRPSSHADDFNAKSRMPVGPVADPALLTPSTTEKKP